MAEQVKNFQHEADFLAAILEHDNTPKDMRDYISEVVLSSAGRVALYTPAVLRVAWPLIRRQESASGDALWWAIIGALRAFANEETDQILDEVSEATRVRKKDCGTEAATEGDDKGQHSGQHSLAELAGHLAAVLTHPETPPELYEAIANEINRFSSDYCQAVSETVPYIESCLRYHQREQREQPEGGSTDDDKS